MALVKELLEYQHRQPVYVLAQDTVLHALQIMAQEDIGALLVVEGHEIVGIFTERDYVRKGEVAGRTAANTLVKEVMTSKMISVTPTTSVEECLRLMQKYYIRHLPVVDGERVIGILSIRDVMEAVIRDRESEITGLQNYIIGNKFQM